MNAARDRADFCLGLLDRDTVLKASDCVVVVRGPAGVFAIQIGGQPQGGVLWKAEAVRKHTYDGK